MTLIASPVVPTRGRLRPLGLDEVTITGGFWAQRQQVNATATLAHIEHWLEREGWIANFDLAAAGELPAGRRGREFSDSEVYKYLEAVAWEIGRSDDPALEARFRAIVARVAAAQEPDGYLNTKFGRPGQGERWSDLEWGHELYCIGHLLQAAVARARTRPGADDGLVEVARRAADLVCKVFGSGGIESVCGHAEIEPALVELGRVTGDERYLEQAALFVERRGHGTLRDIEFGRSYYQDDVPVREATVLRGHAVRAGYLSAGAVDVAVEQGRRGAARGAGRRSGRTRSPGAPTSPAAWARTTRTRRSATTGCSRPTGPTPRPARPSRRSCSAGGCCSRRATPATPTSSSAPCSTSWRPRRRPEGTAFFYANTLHQRGRPGTPARPTTRCRRARRRRCGRRGSRCPAARPTSPAPWPSLAAYVATADDEGLQLHQYAPAAIRTTLPDGTAVALDVETDYPARRRGPRPRARGRRHAVDAHAAGAGVGRRRAARRAGRRGTAASTGTRFAVRRAFRAGDVVELHLPVAPRFTAADPRIDAVRGCLAVERGPEVLCLESVDLAAASGGRVDDIAAVRLDPAVAPRDVGRDGRRPAAPYHDGDRSVAVRAPGRGRPTTARSSTCRSSRTTTGPSAGRRRCGCGCRRRAPRPPSARSAGRRGRRRRRPVSIARPRGRNARRGRPSGAAQSACPARRGMRHGG